MLRFLSSSRGAKPAPGHLLRSSLLGLLASGALLAHGDVQLRNDTGQRVVLSRVPSSAGRFKEVLFGRKPAGGDARQLLPSFHPPAEATLTLEPKEVATLGWEKPPVPGQVAHLRVALCGAPEKCFLNFRLNERGDGFLEPHAEFGPRARLERQPGGILALLGAQEPGPDPEFKGDASPSVIDTELFPEAWPSDRRGAEGKGELRTLPPELKPSDPATSAYLLHQAPGAGYLALQDAAESPGQVLLRVFDRASTPKGGPWRRMLPGPLGAVRLNPGESAEIALDGKLLPGTSWRFRLTLAEDPRTCQLRYGPGKDGRAILEPARAADASLLGLVTEGEGEDSLMVFGFDPPLAALAPPS